MRKSVFISFVVFLFLLLVCIPIVLPIFHNGYYPTQDGEWAVVRAGDMFREIRDHQFPPRFSANLNFGYGYPLFNFAYPFPYYAATILHVFKFGFINSVKTLFFLSVLLSTIFMYLASKDFWKSKTAGIVSAVFFAYFPYRFVDLYVRGSLGESISFIFFPLIFWCIAHLLEKSSKKYIFLAGITYGALIITHNIMAVYFSIIMAATVIFFIVGKKKTSGLSIFIFMFWGILLATFFWLPVLLEKNLVLLSKIPIANRNTFFVPLLKFIIPSWGYGDPSLANGFTYQLGIPQLIVFLGSISCLITAFIKEKKLFGTFAYQCVLLFILLSLFFSFLLFSPSNILWQLPVLKEINFPWTALSVLGFLISLLAGFLATIPKVKYAAIVLAVLCIVLFLPYAHPKTYSFHDDNYYLTNDSNTTASFEFTPLWMKIIPTERPAEKVMIVNGKGSIQDIFYNSKTVFYSVTLLKNSTVRTNTIYYPGWNMFVDGSKTTIDYSNDYGVMDISVPSGNHAITGKFEETPMRFFADIVSVGSLFLLIIWVCIPKPIFWKKK